MKNIIWKQADGTYAITNSVDQINGFPVGTKNENGSITIIYEDSTTHASTMLTREDVPNNWNLVAVDTDFSAYQTNPPINTGE